MKHSTIAPHPFAKFHCSIARTLEQLEPSWTPLILRDVFFGLRRFDGLCKDLGIATNTLTARLEALVAKGILERAPYRDHPVRYEYRPTTKGADLFPVVLSLLRWGDAWTSEPEGAPVKLRHVPCGEATQAEVVCNVCGDVLRLDNVTVHAGPGARIAPGTAVLAAQLPPEPTTPSPGETPAAAGRPRRNRFRLRESFGPSMPPPMEPANDVQYPKSPQSAAAAQKQRVLPRMSDEPQNDIEPQIQSGQ
ncbi:winged helix-turn-helix transcriptional regulator [Pendulispora albinea]|uniref:Helix-turn-helix transcriptional regulator n=1 Tax=Pendulispora albinea TaxID=2741071 RepID=A0ABZ2M4N2_9BACT